MFYGNIEKYRIARELLTCAENAKILDFGAGSGSDWPAFMRIRPDIRFFFFEPNPLLARKLTERVRDSDAVILTSMNDCPDGIDYVVSFSVFEHVFDRVGYLRDCARVLADDGRVYLNFDDGHFRFNLAINQDVPLRKNVGQIRETLANLFRPAAAKAGMVRYFQQRVSDQEAAQQAGAVGLRILSTRYANLVSMKSLAKVVGANTLEDFHAAWLRLEDDLNESIEFRDGDAMGHRDARWLEMPTCTLTLAKAEAR